MKRNLVALLSGVLFSIGLGVAGMTRPDKVKGFLDPTGAWDPSLAFVMAGAVGFCFMAFRLVLRRRAPVLDERFHLPPSGRLELRLLLGAVIFGIGWGLSGYCPGPAVTSLATGQPVVFVFVGAMLAGMALQGLFAGSPAAASGAALSR
jgi:uncharacterized membrane protein YedE/YeeE